MTCPWCPGQSTWVIPVSALLAFVSDLLVHAGMTVCILRSRFVHPRFGPIKCIRTLRAVEADEELTVAYGYDHSPPGKSGPEAPEWYQVELKAFQATQQKWKAWLRAAGDLEQKLGSMHYVYLTTGQPGTAHAVTSHPLTLRSLRLSRILTRSDCITHTRFKIS